MIDRFFHISDSLPRFSFVDRWVLTADSVVVKFKQTDTIIQTEKQTATNSTIWRAACRHGRPSDTDAGTGFCRQRRDAPPPPQNGYIQLRNTSYTWSIRILFTQIISSKHCPPIHSDNNRFGPTVIGVMRSRVRYGHARHVFWQNQTVT